MQTPQTLESFQDSLSLIHAANKIAMTKIPIILRIRYKKNNPIKNTNTRTSDAVDISMVTSEPFGVGIFLDYEE